VIEMSKMSRKREENSDFSKPFSRKRILVCGKGGSGKSSIVALMAHVLHDKGYKVMVLDGDASNPGGLARLMFGLKVGPQALIDFFVSKAKLGLNDGESFGKAGEGFMRLNIGTSKEVLEMAMQRLLNAYRSED